MVYRDAPKLIRDFLNRGSTDVFTATDLSRIVGCTPRTIRDWRLARKIPPSDAKSGRRPAWSRQALAVWSGADKPAYVPTGSEVPEGRIVAVTLHVLVTEETYAETKSFCAQHGIIDVSAPLTDALQSGALTLDAANPVLVDGVPYPRIVANVGD